MANLQQWHISDTHFCDRDLFLIEGRASKFADINTMNEAIIQNWNEKVGDNDRVFHHGDVGSEFLTKEQLTRIVSKLKGRKTLVLGNHDTFLGVKDWLDIGFDEVFRFPILVNKFFLCSHDFCYLEPSSCYHNIHGHIHSMQFDDHLHFTNVSVERINYTPLNFDEILSRIKLEKEKALI